MTVRTISSALQVLSSWMAVVKRFLALLRYVGAQTGFNLKDGDAWYYLEGKEGVMLVGLHQVDGKTIFVLANLVHANWLEMV